MAGQGIQINIVSQLTVEIKTEPQFLTFVGNVFSFI